MILVNDFCRRWRDTREKTLEAIEAVGSSGWYILGEELRNFEAALAEVWGFRHAAGVASGLDAIEISLRALGCRPGEKVLTTPVSAFATTLAILRLGAIPVFVDVDEYGLIDLDCSEAAFRSDPAIRYFVPVHLYGHSLDVTRLRRLRVAFDLKMVEDCAQSIGATHKGLATGIAGQLAATSFYPTKNLGALGDGGAILTDADAFKDHVLRLRDYGQSAKYRHDLVGYNSRLDELQAAILRRAHLPRLPEWTARRRQIARAYTEGIKHHAIRVPAAPPGSGSCWHLFPVFVEPGCKVDFMKHMRARDVETAEHYPATVIEQPALRTMPHEILGGSDRAARLCRSEVSLPIHPYLGDDEVATVIEACNSWAAPR